MGSEKFCRKIEWTINDMEYKKNKKSVSSCWHMSSAIIVNGIRVRRELGVA